LWCDAAECFKEAHLRRKEDETELRPLLGYGFCLVKLGNREEAVKIANELLLQDKKIEDQTDKLEEEIALILYHTEQYNDFATIYSGLNILNYAVDYYLPPYFYSLWKVFGINKLDNVSETVIRHKENDIQEAFEDDDAEWEPGRKTEYIDELQGEIEFIRNTVKEINRGNKPKIDFVPNIVTSCYLYGCSRHDNPTYTSFSY
jgi:hypothetical protein